MLEAIEIAERVRKAVEGWRFIIEGSHVECSLTISLGVATVQRGNLNNPRPSVSKFLENQAHEALLQAKASGRNRVFPTM